MRRSNKHCTIEGVTTEVISHRKNLAQNFKKFNSCSNITALYGKMGNDENANQAADDAFRDIAERVLDGKPLDAFFTLDKSDYARINYELDKVNRDIGSGKTLSTFAATTLIPRAVANKFPNLKRFMDKMDFITNYEKNKFNLFQQKKQEVTSHFQRAFLAKGVKSKKVLKELDKIQGDIMANFVDGNNSKKLKNYIDAMGQKLAGDGGKVLKDYYDYMEGSEDRIVFKKGVRQPIIKVRGADGRHNGEYRRIDDHIVNAAESSRELLNEMGGVLISALRTSKKLAERITTGLNRNNKKLISPKEYRRLNSFVEEIDSSINNIANGIEQNDYFPHYVLSDVLNIRKGVEAMILKNGKNSTETYQNMSRHLSNILDNINSTMNAKINRGKSRSEMLKNDPFSALWDHNPLGALHRYSSDIISFNKLLNMQDVYSEAIGNLEGVDSQTAESMRKFISHTFDTATIGYSQRPEWVNKTTRVISAYEFASKLGLGVTTALRNTLSGAYYLAHMGKKYFQYSNAYRDLPDDDQTAIQKIMGEMGFKFLDSSQTADELIAEGLLPAKGVRKDSLYFDSHTESWKYQKDGVWKKLDAGLNYAVGKSAVFQRLTENSLREKMFIADFMRQLEIFESQSAFKEGKSKKDLYRMAGQMALKKVNKFAFDYSVYNKAPIIGGTHKTGGAVGQMLGIFMHYPMAFANLQYNSYKDAYAAMKSGQGWSNTDVKLATGFMSMYLTTTLMSGLTNMDLSFWINNDTADRIEAMFDYLTSDDPDERERITYGVGGAALATGPLIGDMQKIANGLIHSAVAMDIIGMPDSELLDFMTGYDKFADMTDDDRLKTYLRMINNQGFKVFNNTIPAFTNGTPGLAFVKEFKLHPTKKSKNIRRAINRVTGQTLDKEFLEVSDSTTKLKQLASMLDTR